MSFTESNSHNVLTLLRKLVCEETYTPGKNLGLQWAAVRMYLSLMIDPPQLYISTVTFLGSGKAVVMCNKTVLVGRLVNKENVNSLVKIRRVVFSSRDF